MKILVTGASGNIGSAVVPELVSRGHQVKAVIHSEKQRKKFENLNVEIIKADIFNENSLDDHMKGIDVVIHLVGYLFAPRRSQIVELNMKAAKSVANACLKNNVGRIIFSSSVLVYPSTADLPVKEDSILEASTEYEKAKIEVEKYLFSLADKGLKTTVIRIGHVYGKGVSAVDEFIFYISKGLYRTAGDGKHIIPPVYVGDLANAFALAAENEAAVGEVFNINDDSPMTLKEFSDLIALNIGKKPVKSAPIGLFNAIAAFNEATSFVINRRPFFDLDTVKLMSSPHWGDNSKAKEILGWQPEVKSFKEGVKLCF